MCLSERRPKRERRGLEEGSLETEEEEEDGGTREEVEVSFRAKRPATMEAASSLCSVDDRERAEKEGERARVSTHSHSRPTSDSRKEGRERARRRTHSMLHRSAS